MLLSDYIKYYRAPKEGRQKTTYQIRNDHFYDGMQIIEGERYGIPAKMMNKLRIPSATEIADKQHSALIALGKTQINNTTLQQLNNSINKTNLDLLNIKIQSEITELIKVFEQSIDKLLVNQKESIKLQKMNNLTAISDSELSVAYSDFKQIISQIDNFVESNGLKLTAELNELHQNLSAVESLVASGVHLRGALFDKQVLSFLGKSKPQKTYSFMERLSYLSLNIKGVQMLELGGIKFLQQIPILQDSTTEQTGQTLVGGKQLHQDAILFSNKIKVKVQLNGKDQVMTIADYFKALRQAEHDTVRISILDKNLSHILQQAIGVQSKYSRYGWITMRNKETGVSLSDVFKLNLNEARALRNLYILANGSYQDQQIIGTFDIRVQHPDYNALFSYCLHKFIDKIIASNYLMLTKDGVQDSATFFGNLFLQGKYFKSKGKFQPFKDIQAKYAIQINTNAS